MKGFHLPHCRLYHTKKPVLLSNCVGPSDVVKRGMNGDLFNNSDDAIIKIFEIL